MTGMLLELTAMDAVYSVMGYALIFVVLSILIGYLFLQSKFFGMVKNRKKGKTEKTVAAPQVVEPAPVETNVSDEEELAAVITAAIMMCMEAQGEAPVARTNTGFVVRKIKKI